MKRFKMGVLNNFQTHKMYSTNRKIIYQENKKSNPEKIILKPNPAAEKPEEKKTHQILLPIFQNPNYSKSRSKMGVLNNLQLHDFDIKEYIKSFNEKTQTGFKLDKNNNYDMQQKRLANLAEGVDAADAITKHQMEVGLSSKSDQTNVLLLDGRNNMTGDLDMRGNKIILPSGIDMNRKLITNLDTDQNQDLSTVNMVTLKTNIGQKVDKKYVDAKFVKKTGGTLSGDLILPHDSYPVQGNTNKAVSYETQREIFLSRKESFPMQADINMNNNFIQNVATPTSSHQGVNKGYCDYNFLNRQKGGRIMGSLSMNQNDLFEIPAPKYGSSAVNKNYVDAKSIGYLPLSGGTLTGDLDMNDNKIINIATPTLEKDVANKCYVDSKIGPGNYLPLSGGTLSGNLDMDDNNILKLKEPTAELDGANKHYVDCVNTETRNSFEARLLSAHLTSNTIANVFKYLLDPNELSSERDIIVNGLVDFDLSPHSNKKAYDIDLVYQSGTQSYNSKIGVNLYPLPLGHYTLVMEYFFPENIGISLVAQATKVNITKQNRVNFPNYKQITVQFIKSANLLSDYMYFFIRGKGTTSTNPEGYLIFYGVKLLKDVVPPKIYSHPFNSGMFLYSDDKMKMNMDLDLNGHALVGVQNSFFIHGYFDKSQNPIDVVLNHQFTNQIIPMDCILTNILLFFTL